MTGDSPGTPSTAEDLGVLQRRAFHGVRVLLGRQAVIRGMGLAGAVILARRLTPTDLGLFGIAVFIVGVFSMFGDLGFASHFIHTDAPPTARDLRVSFTAQMIFATGIVACIWMTAPWATHFYSAGPSMIWLVRVLAFGVYLDVFRALYRVQFERNLHYGPIARADVWEALFYQIVAITLALFHYGAWTLVFGLLVSELVGTVFLGIAAPISAKLLFDLRRMRELLPKAIRFQLYAPVNLLGDTATPTIIGTLIGLSGVGFLNWASANARRPLIVIEAVARVSFPHFARVKESPGALRDVLVDYLVGFVWVVLFWAATLAAGGSAAIEVIYGGRWLPAVPALLVFAFVLPLDSVSWLMGQGFAAVGRAMVSVGIVAVRSILLILFTIAFVHPFGMMAIPVAYFAANLVTAPLQLRLFQKGLLTLVLTRSAWVAIPVIGAVASGRGTLMWLNHTSWHGPALRMCAGVLPAIVAYFALTLACLPQRYRPQLYRRLRHPLSLLRGPST